VKTNLITLSVLASLGALAASHAGATIMYDPSVSTATGIGASSVTINGSMTDIPDFTEPWVGELYAQAGECVRLAVITTLFDSELTVAAPNGTVFRDDDSGGDLKPLVRIASAPVTGWYTVQVAHFSGVPVSANFTLKYARYNGGNPNCAVATAPLVLPNGAAEPMKAVAPAER